jgi:hypothetical protein
VLRFLLWRLLGLAASVACLALIGWFLRGGPGKVLKGARDKSPSISAHALSSSLAGVLDWLWRWAPASGPALAPLLLITLCAVGLAVAALRVRTRSRRQYVRQRLEVYRGDHADPNAIALMFEALHKRLTQRWWRRLLHGQPSVSLEVHHGGGSSADQRTAAPEVWLAVSCPAHLCSMVQAALQSTYPNCQLRPIAPRPGTPPAVLRLKKHAQFIKRVQTLDRFEREEDSPMDRLLTAMGACGVPAFVQLALTPTPAVFELFAKHLFKRHEARLSRERREHLFQRDRSMIDDAELRGGLEIQHRALFFVDLRVIAPNRRVCEQVASELRVHGAENRLVERGTTIRHGLLGLYTRRVLRGEGNPLPPLRKGVFASSELGALWRLPSSEYLTVPFARSGVPIAPAPPGILRPGEDSGTLRDTHGPVSIHVELRKQNVAVPGTVEQGKSSFLVATVAEDLRRERCAVIVLDPKGDAAEAAVSLVPVDRVCTVLDFAHPTCGFNPLAVDAPADVIADYVVGALKTLFTDADIRASSDRYLRNAIIAVLANDRRSTLWDAARLLTVGEEGYAYRQRVGARVRTLPEFKEISEFFTAELSTQLADSRSTTTAKLDAPVNKLARLLNSPSIKRVLLNESLRVDFDAVIARGEVLVVKGALGAMGAGNTSTLMQLLIGMLDAALARQQDLVPEHQRVAVALKIDEAPLVLNRGFAETMALKRSAGLETVACWQTDAQWVDRDVRDQLDALFAHRVYFATASARDARAGASLMMAEFSDSVRPGMARLSTLARPDVRLHLPKHHAIVSWSTPQGRQSPFIAQTVPLQLDRERLALHAARQHERGARHLSDLRQPHWDHPPEELSGERRPGPRPSSGKSTQVTPEVPAESYAELAELDRASSGRWLKPAEISRAHAPDRLDLEILALVSALRYVLTSQVHRRFNRTRSLATTQRRLKRLSDAGLIERLQLHRRDGGGVPTCCVITERGQGMLHDHASQIERATHARTPAAAPTTGAPRAGGERLLREARQHVHVAGWALALAELMGAGCSSIRGAEDAVITPSQHAGPHGRAVLGVSDLQLPGGRAPHDFLRTDSSGQLVAVEHFETLRPDAIVEASEPGVAAADAMTAPALDTFVELDGRLPVGRQAAKLERYDHFLSGWSTHTSRYGRRSDAVAQVVFVCRDRARAGDCARAADAALRACRAYAGEYPFDWQYPGRERILFAAERDLHEGLPLAYGVPRLPPEVRVAAAHGDPRAGEHTIERREIVEPRVASEARP